MILKRDSTVYILRGRYVLDNFATVAEAVEALEKLVLVGNIICKEAPFTDGQGYVLGAHLVSLYHTPYAWNSFIYIF